MRFKEFLDVTLLEAASNVKGNLTQAIIKRLETCAKNGDRIVADGKTIWAGLGNRSGLHSYQFDVLHQKWWKSGSNFIKKINNLTAEKIEIQTFRNITRDRGRWLTVYTIDVKAGKSIDHEDDMY